MWEKKETGSLDNMLHDHVPRRWSTTRGRGGRQEMMSYVEPIMLIIMGLILAFVMVSVFGAIYGSYDSIAGME
ncbi:MAG: hypothetical protein ACLTLQ_06425 [[Clostridium] scindens]